MEASDIVVSEVAPDHWDVLVAIMPGRTVFHSLGWLRLVEATHGARVRLLKAMRGRICVGIWPWHEIRKGPLKIVGSPLPGWSTAYQGPLIGEDCPIEEVVGAFMAYQPLRKADFVMCRTVRHNNMDMDLSRFGFQKTLDFETYIIDISQPSEVIWNNFKSECRTRIRKAQKNGIEIRIETDDSYIAEFWEISKEVFRKSGIEPTFSQRFLTELHRNLFPKRLCVLSANYEGRRIAMLVIPHDDVTAMYWAGRGFNSTLSLCPNNLLHWEAILECKRRNLVWYDFISSKGKTGTFKSTFGPSKIVASTHWERSRNPIIALMRNVYERARRKLRRVRR